MRKWILFVVALLLAFPAVALAQNGEPAPGTEINVVLDAVGGVLLALLTGVATWLAGNISGYKEKLKKAAEKGEDYLKAAENWFFETIADFKPVWIAIASILAIKGGAAIGVPIDGDSLANAPLMTGFAISIRELYKRFLKPWLGDLLDDV